MFLLKDPLEALLTIFSGLFFFLPDFLDFILLTEGLTLPVEDFKI